MISWVAISSAGDGPLCLIKVIVSEVIYQEVLKMRDADFIYQQDLGPAKTDKSINIYFTNPGITVLGSVNKVT